MSSATYRRTFSRDAEQSTSAKPTKGPSLPFDVDFCRNPARIRAVFDTSVAVAKSLNTARPQPSPAKVRAAILGLKIDVQQSKRLHWRSVQARPPVVLTTSPNSPSRTPRRPAMEYPSAERLCLINAQNALERKDQTEASRWFAYADRERKLSEWEAAQNEGLGARDKLVSCSADLHSGREQPSYSCNDLIKKTEALDGSIPFVLKFNPEASPGDASIDVPFDVTEDDLLSGTLSKPNDRENGDERRAKTKPPNQGRAATSQKSPHASRQDIENVMLLPSSFSPQYVQESMIGIDPGDRETSAAKALSPTLAKFDGHLRSRKKRRIRKFDLGQ